VGGGAGVGWGRVWGGGVWGGGRWGLQGVGRGVLLSRTSRRENPPTDTKHKKGGFSWVGRATLGCGGGGPCRWAGFPRFRREGRLGGEGWGLSGRRV